MLMRLNLLVPLRFSQIYYDKIYLVKLQNSGRFSETYIFIFTFNIDQPQMSERISIFRLGTERAKLNLLSKNVL